MGQIAQTNVLSWSKELGFNQQFLLELSESNKAFGRTLDWQGPENVPSFGAWAIESYPVVSGGFYSLVCPLVAPNGQFLPIYPTRYYRDPIRHRRSCLDRRIWVLAGQSLFWPVERQVRAYSLPLGLGGDP